MIRSRKNITAPLAMTIKTRIKRDIVGEVVAHSPEKKVFDLKITDGIKTPHGELEGRLESMTSDLINNVDWMEIEGEVVLGPPTKIKFCSECGNEPLYKNDEPYCPVCYDD